MVSEISHVRDRNEMDGAFRLYLMCTNSKMKERGSGGARESILSFIADLLGGGYVTLNTSLLLFS